MKIKSTNELIGNLTFNGMVEHSDGAETLLFVSYPRRLENGQFLKIIRKNLPGYHGTTFKDVVHKLMNVKLNESILKNNENKK
jgi:hypothetical protein